MCEKITDGEQAEDVLHARAAIVQSHHTSRSHHSCMSTAQRAVPGEMIMGNMRNKQSHLTESGRGRAEKTSHRKVTDVK